MTKPTTTPETDAAGTFTHRSGVGADARRATADGTTRFRARFADALAADHFRVGVQDLAMSSIGIGTYLGADADSDDDAYVDAIRCALHSGINVIDTAINYRCQRSERAVGRAVQLMMVRGHVARDELVLCTKAGYIPLENYPPATQEGYQGYLRREFYARHVMEPGDLVAGGHCLAPGFIADCLRRSRQNLGVDAIDVFYLHNPEQQLNSVAPEQLYARIEQAFTLLEARAAAGEIGVYGISTWQGFRVPPGSRSHLSMNELVTIARRVGGDAHHFRVVQFPLSLAMPEAVREATQDVPDRGRVSAIEAAAALGLTVMTSAPLMQGQLTQGLPSTLHTLFPTLTTDAQRALGFARSMPGVTTTLVGMKRTAHVTENLGAAR